MILLRYFLRPKPPVEDDPTPEQAAAALVSGGCLFGVVSTCSGHTIPVGLASDDDSDTVACCKAHYGRLRKLNANTIDRIRDGGAAAFLQHVYEQEEPPPEGVKVVMVRDHSNH